LVIVVFLMTASSKDQAWWWHAHFSDQHFRALHDLGAKGMARRMSVVEHLDHFCEGCAVRKMHRTPFPRASTHHGEHVIDLVHGDLCRPITPVTPNSNKYFVLVFDDFSRYMWLEALMSKDEAFRFFKKIKALAESDRGVRLNPEAGRALPCNNSGAFLYRRGTGASIMAQRYG
jgi:hypothetical protein